MRHRSLTLIGFGLTFLGARIASGTTAADIPCLSSSPAPAPCMVSADVTVTDGSTIDFGARGLVLQPSSTWDIGGGVVSIVAGSFTMQSGADVTGAGGDLTITTTGDINILGTTNTKARIDLSGSLAGSITFIATGNVLISGELRSNSTVTLSDGGLIDVTGNGITLAASGKAGATGGGAGFGGEVDFTADAAFVGDGPIDVSGGDSGGDVTILGLSVTIRGDLNAKGGAGGSGGSLDIESNGGDVILSGSMFGQAAGSVALGGGSGSDLFVFADLNGNVEVNGPMQFTGAGPFGQGGFVDIEAVAGNITQRADIVASAPGGFGGDVSYSTISGDITTANADATGALGGGSIEVLGNERVTIGGTLADDGPNAVATIQGCDVTVAALGVVSSAGTGGTNSFQERGTMSIAGHVVAGASNTIAYRVQAPVITGTVTPPAVITMDATLPPCGPPVSTTTTTTLQSTTTTSRPSTTTTSSSTTTSTSPTTVVTVTTSSSTSTSGSLPTTTSSTATTTTVGQATTTSTTTTVAPTTTTTTTSVTTTTTTSTVPTTTTTTLATTTTTLATTTTTTLATTTTTLGTTTTMTAATTSTTTTTTASSTTTTELATTTTSTTAATTSTTVTLPSTTTTTMPQGPCDPSNAVDCDDGDPCTEDVCDPTAGCLHHPLTGLDAVSCRLEELDQTIEAGPPAAFGGATTQAALDKRARRILKLIERAKTARGRLARANPRSARHLLKAFIHTIDRGEVRGTIAPAVADRLRGLAQQAILALVAFP